MPISNINHLEDLLGMLRKLNDVCRTAATVRARVEDDISEARRLEKAARGPRRSRAVSKPKLQATAR